MYLETHAQLQSDLISVLTGLSKSIPSRYELFLYLEMDQDENLSTSSAAAAKEAMH